MTTGASWHPFIVDSDEYRTLQFAEEDIQSRMRKSAPDELVLSYTQAMMAFMLFVEQPKDILIAGLGGGSLSKFCYRHLPSARITTVEISQEVIDLRNRFCIPPDGPRFSVVCGDFAGYLAQTSARADAILLDGYDDEGVPEALGTPAFYARCREVLTDGGVLVANINLGAVRDSNHDRRLIEDAMGRAVSIRSDAGWNDIVLGFRDTTFPEVRTLKLRARALRQETGIDFPLLLDKIRSGAASPAV